jgi:hypothetical protein
VIGLNERDEIIFVGFSEIEINRLKMRAYRLCVDTLVNRVEWTNDNDWNHIWSMKSLNESKKLYAAFRENLSSY